MITYEIGKPYPHKDHRPGREEIRAVTDDSFFHIVYYCTQPNEDGPNWQKGPMVYGLYVSDDIPCFLIHLTALGLAFEVTINVHTLADEAVDSWLNSSRTLIPMLLMDAHTNIIKAIRLLSIKPTVATQVRDCLEKQDNRYDDATAVEKAVDNLLNRVSTQHMLQTATMYRDRA
jgi:hypothetical protein